MTHSCAHTHQDSPFTGTVFARGLRAAVLFAAAFLALVLTPSLQAQDLELFDPDDAFAQPETGEDAIDADLIGAAQDGADKAAAPPAPVPVPVQPVSDTNEAPQPVDPEPSPGFVEEYEFYSEADAPPAGTNDAVQWIDPATGATVDPETAPADPAAQAAQDEFANAETYGEDDLIGAVQGVFGKGAEGIARAIEDLLKKEGEPNGYIVGREAGGAFIFGARYGSGTLHHKIEGQKKVYWTGPSLGIDAGANAANTFVLVYNLFDTEDLFERFPAGEGQAYLVGGVHASYVRRGDIVLIPIRLGAGVRLGLNAGYLRFSKKQRWLPF